MSARILKTHLSDLYLTVEMAFGAAPGSDGPWTDITAYLVPGGVSITVLRADEASQTQPATCEFTVKGESGLFTRGPQGNPGLRDNIPVRVRATLGGVSYTRFQGELEVDKPTRDSTGRYVRVAITANGELNRLGTARTPLLSPMRHYVQAQSNLVSYWPCEDGQDATSFVSAVTGAPAMVSSTGLPKPGSYGGFVASVTAPTLGAETYTALCDATANVSAGAQIWLLINVPADGSITDQTRIASIYTSGGVGLTRIDLLYLTTGSGSFNFKAYNGATQVAAGTSATPPGGANGQDVLLGFSWTPIGSLLNLELDACALKVGGLHNTGDSSTAYAINHIANIRIAPDATCSGISLGHLYLQNAPFDITTFTVPDAATAFTGETATDRIIRLAAERGDVVDVTGASAQTMGPQPIATYLSVLRECEAVDGGILYDGVGRGLAYIARDSRENQAAAMTLNAAGRPLAGLQPVRDSLGRVNTFTASRNGGSSYTYTDTTSRLSVANIGEKPDSASINCETDSILLDYAAWRVGLGGVDDYRYPQLYLRLHAAPAQVANWLQVRASSRIDVLNLGSVWTAQDPKDLSMLAEGWNEQIDLDTWDVTVNTVSYEPWRIAVWGTTGVTGEYDARYEVDGSTVSGTTAAGSNTLTVATPSGPLWITGSGDSFPIQLNVGGLKVTCSSISGSSSPQTFNVTPTTMQILDGATVSVWRNPVLSR